MKFNFNLKKCDTWSRPIVIHCHTKEEFSTLRDFVGGDSAKSKFLDSNNCINLYRNRYNGSGSEAWYASHGYKVIDFSSILDSPEKQIHMSQKNNSVHCVYKENGKVVDRTTAKCHPEDEFDFATGAQIAYGRLKINQEPQKDNTLFTQKTVYTFDKFKFIEDMGVEEYKESFCEDGFSWVDFWHNKEVGNNQVVYLAELSGINKDDSCYRFSIEWLNIELKEKF